MENMSDTIESCHVSLGMYSIFFPLAKPWQCFPLHFAEKGAEYEGIWKEDEK